jgi:hypothetical protein
MKRGVTIPQQLDSSDSQDQQQQQQQPRVKPKTTASTPQVKVIHIDDDDDDGDDGDDTTQRLSNAPEGLDEFIVHETDTYNKGIFRFSAELGTSIHTNPETAYKVVHKYISYDETTQIEGDSTYQRIAHDMVLDFQSDGGVLVFHSDGLTAVLSLRDSLLAPKATPADTLTIFGYTRNLPVTNTQIFRNILRTAVCRNGYYDFKLLPTDLPIESRAVPCPYRALAFMLPSATSNVRSSDHFAALIYYAHDHDSRPPVIAREGKNIAGRFSGHRASRDAPVRLYFYDSLAGINLSNARLVAKLLSDIRFFNDSGSYEIVPVFLGPGGHETFQEVRECSSFSLFFAERAREAALKGSFRALLASDYLLRDNSACAVSLLRQTRERITSESKWWEATAVSSQALYESVERFVVKRVTFSDGNSLQRSASLIEALTAMLAHTVVSGTPNKSQKILFADADPEDKLNIHPDIIRLYLLSSLVLPNNVLFSTSITQLSARWEESVSTYRMVVEHLRNGNANARETALLLPRLVIWLSLPEEDASHQPLGLRSPTLVVCRPHYTMARPQAAARLCHISVYTKTQSGVTPEQHCSAVNNDLLSGLFYEHMKNYAEDPSQAYEPDNARFVSWYSSWRYGAIDILRNIAKHDAYFDYYESDETGENVATWARTFTTEIRGVRPEAIQAERKKIDHRNARMHLRGKLHQLLSLEELHEDSANRTTALFNSRGVSKRIDLDADWWRYSDVKPRVTGEPAPVEAATTSLLRTQWSFCYYNLTFAAAVDGCINQQLGTNGWGVTSVPCALEVQGTSVIAALETWAVVTEPEWIVDPRPTVPMPVLLCGARVGLESTQPCYFGLLDIVRLFYSPRWAPEWRNFFVAHNQASFTLYPLLRQRFGIFGGPITGTQDPYARVLLDGFDDGMASRIDSVVSTLKRDVRSIDVQNYRDATKTVENEAVDHVILIAAAFIVSKARL